MRFVERPFDLQKTRDFIIAHGMTAEPRVYALVEAIRAACRPRHIQFDDDSVFELGWVLNRHRGEGYMPWRLAGRSYNTRFVCWDSARLSWRQCLITCMPGAS